MNEEFLVEPTGFNNALELKYILEKFGFFQGRFIGQFPKGWKKQIYENMCKLYTIYMFASTNLISISFISEGVSMM